MAAVLIEVVALLNKAGVRVKLTSMYESGVRRVCLVLENVRWAGSEPVLDEVQK